jgi:hypothetical protein
MAVDFENWHSIIRQITRRFLLRTIVASPYASNSYNSDELFRVELLNRIYSGTKIIPDKKLIPE